MLTESERLLNLPEKKDNDTIIPNDKSSKEIIKQIIGEYSDWFDRIQIMTAEINKCFEITGFFRIKNYYACAHIQAYNGESDRQVQICIGSNKIIKTFKTTKGELRAAIESAWMELNVIVLNKIFSSIIFE